MKLVNLILYSETIPEYIKMKNTLEKYLSTLHNFHYFFYTFDESLEDNYKIEGNIIYIKGNDTFIPGILEKTIKTFEIINNLNIEYDFIIRTNISTVINFPLLQRYLIRNNKSNIEYAGNKLVLTWNDLQCGLFNNRYYNIPFITGICMILSRRSISEILLHKEELDYSVIDDVAIGILLNKYKIPPINIKEVIIENTPRFNYSKIIFRNKSLNRENDVKKIVEITDILRENTLIENMI